MEKLESVQSKLSQHNKQDNKQIANALLGRAEIVGANIKIVAELLEDKTIEDLRAIIDYFKLSGESVIALLGIASENKANLILMMTPKVCKDDFNAIGLIKEIAPIIEGAGGCRKDMAQAGGKKPDKLQDALNHFLKLVKTKL